MFSVENEKRQRRCYHHPFDFTLHAGETFQRKIFPNVDQSKEWLIEVTKNRANGFSYHSRIHARETSVLLVITTTNTGPINVFKSGGKKEGKEREREKAECSIEAKGNKRVRRRERLRVGALCGRSLGSSLTAVVCAHSRELSRVRGVRAAALYGRRPRDTVPCRR